MWFLTPTGDSLHLFQAFLLTPILALEAVAPALLMVCLLARDEVTTLALRALSCTTSLRLLLGARNVPAELGATLVSSGGARRVPLFPRGPASLFKGQSPGLGQCEGHATPGAFLLGLGPA